jgi:hypothetical protein
MRSWFLLSALAVFGSVLSAQAAGPTPGLEIVTIVHEPTANDVGPYISGLQIPNPFYDPLQPNGEPEFNTAYGNGGGLADELDSISDEFYALGGTTTHDLAILLNTTGADIIVDSTTITLAASRPKKDVPQQPEQGSPDSSAVSTIYAFDQVSVTVPDGSSVALFLISTKWRQSLDTSPREYIWTFTFSDTGANPFVVEGDLVVPEVGGSDPSGCVSDPNGYPTSVWLLATGGIAAILYRRKRLAKARV